MPADVALQADLAFRLLLAAVLGAAIGIEREIHEHPAGMRTHLLVSLGAAIFTVVGIYGFGGPGPGIDPSRIAAQVVSGIGFLGAGAILKYGTSIRGLTTAASLWATAAVGLAVGAGSWIVGLVGTAIIVFSLWPLRMFIDRLGLGHGRLRLRVTLARLDALASVTHELNARRVEILAMQTEQHHKIYELDLDLRVSPGTKTTDIVHAMSSLPGVEVAESTQSRD